MKQDIHSWYVLYTLLKHEKKINDNLRRRGFDTYLPLITERRQWSDRTKSIEAPLFSCYLFIKIQFQLRYEVFKTKGVLRYLDDNSYPTKVSESDIDLIKRITNRPAACSSLLEQFEAGDTIRVTSGPLQGTVGQMVSKKGNHRLLVNVNSLNKTLVVDISGDSIEKVSPHVMHNQVELS